MRSNILFSLFLTFGMSQVQAQTVQLIPDSCTFCLFQISDGGTGWFGGNYGVFPNQDTLVLGNSYIRVSSSMNPYQPFAIRQVGNKLMGVVADSLTEYLLMDFDAHITDTIHGLYSEGFSYDAVVLNKDSVAVNNGLYSHFIQLEGVGYHTQSGFVSENWNLVWNERGLCAANGLNTWDLGGVLYNVPTTLYAISAIYSFPEFCTTDPVYTNPSTAICDNCNPQTNNLPELFAPKLTISPNPAENEVTIQMEDAAINKLTIYTIYGLKVEEQLVYSKKISVQISGLHAGFYWLKIETDRGQVSSGFVKI